MGTEKYELYIKTHTHTNYCFHKGKSVLLIGIFTDF